MMRRLTGLIFVFGYLVMTGCSSSPARGNPAGAAPPQATPPAAAAASDDSAGMPVPPAGAIYTLHCATFSAPTHIEDATRTKEMLIESTKSHDWYVVHGTDVSD